MEPVREALIIATDSFADPKLHALQAPARDAEELARVLGNPEIGDFRVQVSLNEPDYVVRRKLSEFFRERGRDDLLLLHVSSHGLKDEDGTLYFATTNTDVDHLEATAVPSEFVNRQMTRSRSRRMVLLLDCCFGGAFARGFVHRGGDGVDLADSFNGRGRVVLTASRAMEWAFEGDHVEGEARPSIFTAAIVDGLETGRADRDQDSRISVDELYEYVYEQVREATPNQTPSKWTFDVEGELYLARSSYRLELEPAVLPPELQAAIESPLAYVRFGAVEELARALQGADPGLALAAGAALRELVRDDSRLVAEAATRTLVLEPERRETALVADAHRTDLDASVETPDLAAAEIRLPTVARPRAPHLPVGNLVRALASLRGWSSPLALVGAAALAIGYVVRTGYRGSLWDAALSSLDPYRYTPSSNVGPGPLYPILSQYPASWLVWSPIEAFGVALLAAAIVGVRVVLGRGRQGTNGALVGIGALSLAGSLALLAPPYTRTVAYTLTGGLLLTLFGALAILCAGLLGAATNPPIEPVGSPQWSVLAGGLGAAFLVVTLFLDVASRSGPFYLRMSGEGAAHPAPPTVGAGFGHLAELGYSSWLELTVAAGLSAVAATLAYRVPRTRLLVAWLLIAVALQSALHVSGLLFQLVKFDYYGEFQVTWRLGGPVGLVAGVPLAVAGISMLRAGRAPRGHAPELA